jgi:glycosyltransferase involved in cell wall biosynthesis
VTDKATQNWSIIILCFNEEGNIKKVVEDTIKILPIISKNQGQIVIVNDGSIDNSDSVISELKKLHSNIHYIKHETNKGIGEALHSGYKNATEENVIMIPGDGQFDLNEIVPYKNFRNDSFLSFYRTSNPIYSKTRKILSSINRCLNRYLIGIDLIDVNWIKAYKNDSLSDLNLKVRSSLIESEICSKLIFNGASVIEIQSKYGAQVHGKSHGASYKIIKQALVDIPKLILVCINYKRIKQKNS